jgi:hypothetical protein
VQMRLEFWSTSFATSKLFNMNLLVELTENYPPVPLISGENGSVIIFPSRHLSVAHPLRLLPPTLAVAAVLRTR